jgi:hypothetical protein
MASKEGIEAPPSKALAAPPKMGKDMRTKTVIKKSGPTISGNSSSIVPVHEANMTEEEEKNPREAWGVTGHHTSVSGATKGWSPVKDGEKHKTTSGGAIPKFDEDSRPKSSRDRIVGFLENQVFQTFVGVFTVFSLYGDDMRAGYFFKNSDFYFYAAFLACLIIFAWELTMQCIVVEGYKGSFFFWLDVIATGSLILDIPWLTDRLVAIYSSGMSSNNATYGDVIARAGRAARVGTRAGRIVRLVKLMQVFSAVNPEEWCACAERKEEL